ncbi:unnamed protein product, partial [Amoebophrya sp. A120]
LVRSSVDEIVRPGFTRHRSYDRFHHHNAVLAAAQNVPGLKPEMQLDARWQEVLYSFLRTDLARGSSEDIPMEEVADQHVMADREDAALRGLEKEQRSAVAAISKWSSMIKGAVARREMFGLPNETKRQELQSRMFFTPIKYFFHQGRDDEAVAAPVQEYEKTRAQLRRSSEIGTSEITRIPFTCTEKEKDRRLSLAQNQERSLANRLFAVFSDDFRDDRHGFVRAGNIGIEYVNALLAASRSIQKTEKTLNANLVLRRMADVGAIQ